MIAITTERTNKGVAIMGGPWYDPFNPKSRNYMGGKTQQDLLDEGYILLPQYDRDSWPLPEDNGMEYQAYHNIETSEVYYLYTPIPEREADQRIAALEAAVDTLSLELLMMGGA